MPLLVGQTELVVLCAVFIGSFFHIFTSRIRSELSPNTQQEIARRLRIFYVVMSVYAQGATELLLALATPTPKGYWGVPVLVWGRPGTGKSTFIESLGRNGFPVFTMIASLHDPTDFSGLPVLHDGRMRFAPPDWMEVFEQSGRAFCFWTS